jgi:hypothetical protein
VNAFSLQYRKPVRMRWGVVFFLSLLALPYLVDVVYYGDFTPTHFAQETFIEEDAQALDDKGLSFIADDQDDAVVIKISSPAQWHTRTQNRSFARDVSPPQYLVAASLISRPPPSS